MTPIHRTLLILATIISFEVAFASEAKYPYTVSKGELKVLGHVLRSKDIRAIEGEYFVSFEESPNKQWVVISYDEPFERTVVWLYDKASKAAPQLVKAVRVGKHFGVDWYGDHVFSVFWTGMGYKTSQVFSVKQPNHYKQLNDIVAYDPGKDIYALLNPDKNFNFFIAIGRIFHTQEKEERFPIPLFDKDLTAAVGYVEDLKFTDKGFTVTYKNNDEKDVTGTFQSKLIENAKP